MEEQCTWVAIDDRVERNRIELDVKIKDGLQDKDELTRKQKEMRE